MSLAMTLPFETTLHVRDHCLCLHTQRAARALARHFDDAFRPLSLTNTQFSLLMSLNQPTPPAMGEIAALLVMDRTSLTAALKPLKRRNLLDVQTDEKDRRSRRVVLTAKGRSLLVAATEIWRSAHDMLHAQLDGATRANLPAGLRDVAGLLQRN
jgi:DNA-binding MarR family transcriptional regulator